MVKRVLMVFIVVASMVALQGSDVSAHLAGYTYSPTFRHVASYDCLGHFFQIPNPEQHPAAFQCKAVVQELQVICENPKGKRVTPGTPSGPYTLIGQAPFNEQDAIDEKIKGRADKTIHFGDPSSVLFTACSQRNRNWITVDELILSVDVTLTTFDCVDEACETLGPPAFQSKHHCTIPPGFSLPDNPPPGPGEEGNPTEYDCVVTSEEHCDKTGGCVP